jgi:hypothetical protein
MENARTTIQINSLKALERLLGGDTELEIQARNSIVQDFTKKYLKEIANKYTDETIKDLKKSVKNEVHKQFEQELGSVTGVDFWRAQVKFCPEVAQKFRDLIKTLVYEEAVKVIKEEILKLDLPLIVEGYMNRSIEHIVNEKVKAKLTQISKIVSG